MPSNTIAKTTKLANMLLTLRSVRTFSGFKSDSHENKIGSLTSKMILIDKLFARNIYFKMNGYEKFDFKSIRY